MREKINEEVSVVMFYSSKQRVAKPHLLNWQNKDYSLGKVDYHHTIYEGKTLHHIYDLLDKDSTMHFRLNFNTDNLHWTLEVVSDGLAN